MPTVEYDLEEGIDYDEDPRTTMPRFTLMAHVKDLDQGTTQTLLAQAIAFLPPRYSPASLAGIPSVYGYGSSVLLSRRLKPWPPCDVFATLNYGPRIAGTLEGPVKVEIGTTLLQQQTVWDAANIALPYAMRVPIFVDYDSTQPNAAPSVWHGPGTGPTIRDGGSVPVYRQHSTARFTTTLVGSDYTIGTLSTKYSGYVNSTTWKGEPPGTILMMAVNGVSEDGEITYVTTFDIAYDPFDMWTPYLQFILEQTGQPVAGLTNGQVAGNNGIKPIVVQGSTNFNSLPI